MEIIELLQSVLLLGLLVAVAILLFSLRTNHLSHDKRDRDGASRENRSRISPDRAARVTP